MALWKRTRFWWGSYHDPRTGEFVRRSTKCADRNAAAAVLREWERAASDPHYRATHSTPLRVAIASYKDAKRMAGRAKGTISMITAHTGHFARVFGDETQVRAISAAEVDRYITTRHAEGAERTTIAKELSTLRGVLRLAHRHGYCEAPSSVMPLDYTAKSRPVTRRLRSLDELNRVVYALPPDRQAHLLYLVATASDLGTSFLARRSDIGETSIFVRGTKTGSRERRVPIIDLTRPMVDRVLAWAPASGPMFRRWPNIRRDLAAACARAGVDRITPRDCRRTIGSWLRELGVAPHLIAQWLGHADARMAESVYAPLHDAEALGAQVESAIAACAAPVRDAVDPVGQTAQDGRPDAAENTAFRGAQGQNRTVDTWIFSPGATRRKHAKRLQNHAVTLPDGTRMYVREPRTLLELVDQALAV